MPVITHNRITQNRKTSARAIAISVQTQRRNRLMALALGLMAATMYAAIAIHYSHGF